MLITRKARVYATPALIHFFLTKCRIINPITTTNTITSPNTIALNTPTVLTPSAIAIISIIAKINKIVNNNILIPPFVFLIMAEVFVAKKKEPLLGLCSHFVNFFNKYSSLLNTQCRRHLICIASPVFQS